MRFNGSHLNSKQQTRNCNNITTPVRCSVYSITILHRRHLVISQANELTILRGILCLSCKRKFIEASTAPSPSFLSRSGGSSPNESDRKPFSRQTEKKTGPSPSTNLTPYDAIATSSPVAGPNDTVPPRRTITAKPSPSHKPTNHPTKPKRQRSPISSNVGRSTNKASTTNAARTSNYNRASETPGPVTRASRSQASSSQSLRVRTPNLADPLCRAPSSGTTVSSKLSPTFAHLSVKDEFTDTPSSSIQPSANRTGNSELLLTFSPDTKSSPPPEPFTFEIISPAEKASDHPDLEPPWLHAHGSRTQASNPLETSNDSHSPWSVTHSSDVKRRLDVAFERAFCHKDRVNCVKFSKDGRYLAVGVSGGEFNQWNGKAIIYSTETGIERWSAFYGFFLILSLLTSSP